MKKTLLKSAMLGIVGVGLVAGNAMATPVSVYEKYEGYQFVAEDETYTFDFDLVLSGNANTNSALTMTNDEAIGFDNIPLESAYVNIGIYSDDFAFEKMQFELTAYFDSVTTTLFDGWIFLNSWNGPNKLFSFDVSSTGILDDPYGDISITASFTPWYTFNNNDFAITEVGIGGTYEPVPEPTTMLLFGTGLAALVAARRVRRKK